MAKGDKKLKTKLKSGGKAKTPAAVVVAPKAKDTKKAGRKFETSKARGNSPAPAPNAAPARSRAPKSKRLTSSRRGAKGDNKVVDDNDNDINMDNVSIDDYYKDYPYLKPPVHILLNHETDVRVAMSLFAEETGYDYNNSAIINENCRSNDDEIRNEAINGYKHLIETMAPSLNEKTNIRDKFYSNGGHHQQVLQVCSVCGINDYISVLNGDIYNIDSSFMNGVLRLNDEELKLYSHSRVEGYTNVTALWKYAYDNNQSLEWAYNDLYKIDENENNDAKFIKFSKEAFHSLYPGVGPLSTPTVLVNSDLP